LAFFGIQRPINYLKIFLDTTCCPSSPGYLFSLNLGATILELSSSPGFLHIFNPWAVALMRNVDPSDQIKEYGSSSPLTTNLANFNRCSKAGLINRSMNLEIRPSNDP
jgi:hypothetical protein